MGVLRPLLAILLTAGELAGAKPVPTSCGATRSFWRRCARDEPEAYRKIAAAARSEWSMAMGLPLEDREAGPPALLSFRHHAFDGSPARPADGAASGRWWPAAARSPWRSASWSRPASRTRPRPRSPRPAWPAAAMRWKASGRSRTARLSRRRCSVRGIAAGPRPALRDLVPDRRPLLAPMRAGTPRPRPDLGRREDRPRGREGGQAASRPREAGGSDRGAPAHRRPQPVDVPDRGRAEQRSRSPTCSETMTQAYLGDRLGELTALSRLVGDPARRGAQRPDLGLHPLADRRPQSRDARPLAAVAGARGRLHRRRRPASSRRAGAGFDVPGLVATS